MFTVTIINLNLVNYGKFKKTPLDIRGKEKLSLKQLNKEMAEFEKKLVEKLKKG